MLQPKILFEAGLKIIGVLAIVWSFTHIAPVVIQFFSIYNEPEMMSDNDLTYYRLSLIFQVLYPVILLIIGIYLLRSGRGVIEFAFRNLHTDKEDKAGLLFVLFMKLAGLSLIIYALPKTFQLISNVIFASSVQGISMVGQTEFIAHNLVATVINLLFGLYLLRSGKLFYRIGFSKDNEVE